MFESTFMALHSSFRAVLSVVEHMSRVRHQFANIFSAFTAIKIIRWAYLKLRSLLGMSVTAANPDMDQIFTNADAKTDDHPSNKNVKWPILLYTFMTLAGMDV